MNDNEHYINIYCKVWSNRLMCFVRYRRLFYSAIGLTAVPAWQFVGKWEE